MRFIRLILLLLAPTYVFANDPLVEIPFTIEHEHIYVQAILNGQDTVHFAFDTGARANLLDKKIAQRLNINITGRQQVQAVAGAVTMETSTGNAFKLEDFQQRNQTFLIMDLDHLGDEDTPMDGVIGGGIFDRYAVEIDYDQFKIRLFEFGDYDAKDYQEVSFSLNPFRVPVIPGNIFLPDGNSITGDFLVDTGAALAFSLNTPFAEENELYSRMGKGYEYRFRVLSEKSSTAMARLVKTDILNSSFENMTVRLATAKSGVSASGAVSGIVGLEILKRFNTIYDYRNRVMYIKPSHFYDEPFRINYSGLKIMKANGMFLVEDVYKGSAGDIAKIKVGDRIKSVDGRKDMTRDEFHPYIQNAKGVVALEIIRDNKTIKVNLKPKAMI